MPASSASNKSRRPRSRRNYTSVANEDVDEDFGVAEDTFNDEDRSAAAAAGPEAEKSLVNGDDDEHCDLTVIILDSAQKKFPIKCNKNWTVGKFKSKSAQVHKVHPNQQVRYKAYLFQRKLIEIPHKLFLHVVPSVAIDFPW